MIDFTCDTCGKKFELSADEYDGRWDHPPDVPICQDCEEANVKTDHIDSSATELLRLLKSGLYTDERVWLALKVSWYNGYAQAVREQMAKLQEQVSA